MILYAQQYLSFPSLSPYYGVKASINIMELSSLGWIYFRSLLLPHIFGIEGKQKKKEGIS